MFAQLTVRWAEEKPVSLTMRKSGQLVQIDGDAAGDTPLFIEVIPDALRVLVP